MSSVQEVVSLKSHQRPAARGRRDCRGCSTICSDPAESRLKTVLPLES